MRANALAEARTWIGTPYQHQASAKGLGCDCLGLVRGVWRAVVGDEPDPAPPYSADWAERGGEETLLAAARRWLVEIPTASAEPGDVLLFRMSGDAPAKHCGILSSAPSDGAAGRMIHAYWGRWVVEGDLSPWWNRRLVAAFTWPEQTGG